MTRPHCRHPLHLALMMMVTASACWLIEGCEVYAGGVCHGSVCRVQTVQKVVAAPYVQPYVPTPVYYQVGQELQQEAVATAAFRNSPEYEEFLRLQGYKAAVDALTAAQGVTEAEDLSPSEVPPSPSNQPPTPPTDAPAETTGGLFETRYPTLAAHCKRCHTGDEPKGGVWIDGTDAFDPDERDAIAAAVINGRMPHNKPPLEAQDTFNLLVELFTEHE